jgi:hypothetical protein
MNEHFTAAFVRWVRQNQDRLEADGVTVDMPDKIIGNGTSASFFTGKGKETKEIMVEIWDYGFSEFYVSDPHSEQVKVTHYEFQATTEMSAVLDQLVNKMSPVLA